MGNMVGGYNVHSLIF
ncbi:MAG: hypothetical protein ACKPHT_26175 [Microcystis panniformis]|nr:hypothetical protein [Microcystis aeruginosa]MDB9507838.1 hypothetical protein [Microcystis aeruginosa CS-338/01]